jgi:ribosomal protein S18 acetylase RimI-like enzyme
MLIRRLQPEDAPAYGALRLRALREHPEAFTSRFEEESAKGPALAEQRLRGHGLFWGAFAQDRQLAGMVGLDREQRVKNRHKATVVGMYVAPEWSRLGAGQALMEALIAEARVVGIELLVLTVTHGNDTATHLYRRMGFTSFGVEPDAIRVDGVSYGKEHMYLRLLPAQNA